MERFIEKLSRETGKLEKYKLIELTEEVTIKKEKFKVTHKYYKRLSDEELFEPFEDPDYNLTIDYNIYRNKNNLLCSEEIKEIRNTYKLNIRDFSSILGISYTNLSSIENGSLQPKYIDNLMRLAKDPYAFRNLMISRSSELTQDAYEKLIKLLDNLVLTSYKEHEALAKKVSSYHLEIRNQIIRISNTIEYNTKNKNLGDTTWKKQNSSSEKLSWRTLISQP